MTEDGCSRAYAKEQFNIPWTWDQKLRGSKSQFLKDYDTEAKRIQPELMARPEHQWGSRGNGLGPTGVQRVRRVHRDRVLPRSEW